MVSYSQHVANAMKAVTKNALDGAPATLIKPGRPRTISEILDITETFVCGYPQSAEELKRFDRN